MAERKLYKWAFHRQFIRQLIADEMNRDSTLENVVGFCEEFR